MLVSPLLTRRRTLASCSDDFAKGVLLNKKKVKQNQLKWQKDVVSRSLYDFQGDKDLSKLAIRIHKAMLGAWTVSLCPHTPVLQRSTAVWNGRFYRLRWRSLHVVPGHAGAGYPAEGAWTVAACWCPYRVVLSRVVLCGAVVIMAMAMRFSTACAQGLETPEIVDEIYLQIMKHLTCNPRPESAHRGWQVMCMAVGTFPPSRDLEDYLLNFILQHMYAWVWLGAGFALTRCLVVDGVVGGAVVSVMRDVTCACGVCTCASARARVPSATTHGTRCVVWRAS
jgi:hypothetical protein